MPRIAISDNTLVDFSDERWRLIQLESDALPSLLIEVKAGGGFRYAESFGIERALPATGELAALDIRELSLAWSPEASAWQLSLTWSPELSFSQESRSFVALAIADPQQSREGDARSICEGLARVLRKPLESDSVNEAPPEPEPAPLAALPLNLGLWQLQPLGKSEDGGLRLIRDASWRRGKLRQILWHGLLTAVYLWVSLATLNNELALPNAGTLIPDPSLLPYLGIGVAGLLLILIIREILRLRREPDRLIIRSGQNISAFRGESLRWSIDAAEAQSVYVSELVKKRDRRPVLHHAELNLLLADGKFRRLTTDASKRKDPLLPGFDAADEKSRPPGVAQLDAAAASTETQAAALHIALCLGALPVYYDRRFK